MSEEPQRYRGQRGPNKVKRESMKLVAIRLPQEVVDHFGGRTPLMRAVLMEFIRSKT